MVSEGATWISVADTAGLGFSHHAAASRAFIWLLILAICTSMRNLLWSNSSLISSCNP